MIHPPVLLPATTALGTLDNKGRVKGMLAGANVVMPNLSPRSVRKKYELYNNKVVTGQESAQELEELKMEMEAVSMVLFAPLYLSNYCVNGCVYCPYHLKNKTIHRKKLTQEEVRKEVIALRSRL